MESGVRDTFTDRHAVTVCQRFVIAQHFGQAIERDAAVEVVNVVDADVGREPLKH